jgi:hypothetical protein
VCISGHLASCLSRGHQLFSDWTLVRMREGACRYTLLASFALSRGGLNFVIR